MVFIFDPACELLPPWAKELYLCAVAPLLYLLSDLLPPFPMYSIYRLCDCGGWGGGVLKCTVDHILQEFYSLFLTIFRTYKIAFSPPQTKMTSKDDIKGIMSLKFLRPWETVRVVLVTLSRPLLLCPCKIFRQGNKEFISSL